VNSITQRVTRRLAKLCPGFQLPGPIAAAMNRAVTDRLDQGHDPKVVERVVERVVRAKLVGLFGIHHHIGKNARTGTETIVMDKNCGDFDTSAEVPWGAECVTHGAVIFVDTKAVALDCARDPTNFCENCMARSDD